MAPVHSLHETVSLSSADAHSFSHDHFKPMTAVWIVLFLFFFVLAVIVFWKLTSIHQYFDHLFAIVQENRPMQQPSLSTRIRHFVVWLTLRIVCAILSAVHTLPQSEPTTTEASPRRMPLPSSSSARTPTSSPVQALTAVYAHAHRTLSPPSSIFTARTNTTTATAAVPTDAQMGETHEMTASTAGLLQPPSAVHLPHT